MKCVDGFVATRHLCPPLMPSSSHHQSLSAVRLASSTPNHRPHPHPHPEAHCCMIWHTLFSMGWSQLGMMLHVRSPQAEVGLVGSRLVPSNVVPASGSSADPCKSCSSDRSSCSPLAKPQVRSTAVHEVHEIHGVHHGRAPGRGHDTRPLRRTLVCR